MDTHESRQGVLFLDPIGVELTKTGRRLYRNANGKPSSNRPLDRASRDYMAWLEQRRKHDAAA